MSYRYQGRGCPTVGTDGLVLRLMHVLVAGDLCCYEDPWYIDIQCGAGIQERLCTLALCPFTS